jgi:hypothetical protein
MLKLPTTEVPFPAVYNARWVVFSIWREGSQAIDAVELRKKRIADSGVNTLTLYQSPIVIFHPLLTRPPSLSVTIVPPVRRRV